MPTDPAFASPGRFWKGNVHTHSDLSDGMRTPEAVCATYREAGYDFLEFLLNGTRTNWISGTISTQQWGLLIAYFSLPIVMLADRQTTGGYTKVGVLTQAAIEALT